MTALRRIQKELADVKNNPISGLIVEPKEDNILDWSCQIKATSDSPYKGGTFHFNLVFPDNFPFKPPTVTFTTKIYHPGFDEEGHICVPILRDQWKPSVTVSAVLHTVQDKLNNPSPEDPFEPEIAAMLKENKSKFLATARDWTKKFVKDLLPYRGAIPDPRCIASALLWFSEHPRKKSDAKRAQVPEHLLASSDSQSTQRNELDPDPDLIPTLPPASDFRTSLILPSLSRRFTLLRASNGDPVSLGDIRSKIVEQRRRGAENQIFEEEEDMILQALGRLQSANGTESVSPVAPTPSNTATIFSPTTGGTFASQQDSYAHLSLGGDSDYPSSIRSGIASSIASSPSSTYPRSNPSSPSASRTSGSPRYSSKRNSNNMFASGRFHDQNYLRSVNKVGTIGSRSTTSLAGSDSHGGSVRSVHSIRETDAGPGRVSTPETDAFGDTSVLPVQAPSLQTGSQPLYTSPLSVPIRISKDFTIQQVRRTSLALEEVIRGIEEEVEETIMVPRTSSSRAGTVNSRAQSPKGADTPSAVGTPIPWMTDEARVDDRDDDEPALPHTATSASYSSPSPSPSPGPYPRPGTTSPTPRLPGYIPGMTRPLTPRDADSDRDDGQTGYSTTPRARSPAQPYYSHHMNHSHTFSSSRHHHHSSLSSDGQSILPPSILRSSRGSGSTQIPPIRTTSPGLSPRSRGNSASTPQVPSPIPSPGPEERFKSDLLSRRPMSPFIGTVTTTPYGGSRPGTPSNAGPWTPTSPLAQVHTLTQDPSYENNPPKPGHNRSGSVVSSNSAHGDGSFVAMPISSPALPDDSPLIDGRNGVTSGTFGSWVQAQNPNQSRNGEAIVNGGHEIHRESAISSIDIGQSSYPHRPSTVAAKIAARAPTPVSTHPRSPATSESGHTHEPILLHRTVSKRSQKRMQSPTPPPQVQSRTLTPPILHTTSSSSNSSSNFNLYSNGSTLFSPMLNTSASSLVSLGSSYHSWADEKGTQNGWDQLVEYDSQRSAWQDIPSTESRTNEKDDVSETFGSPEQELHFLTGLTKVDLATVQKRLVTDALTKRDLEPPRSPSRRRRMSASRTSFSVAQSGRESGTNSPAPPRQATPVPDNGLASSPPRHSPDNTSRANALLDSVLNSIQSQSTPSTPPTSDAPSVEPASSTDDSSSKLPSISSSGRESREDDNSSALRLRAIADALSVTQEEQQAIGSDDAAKSAGSTSQSHEEDSGEATEVPISHFWRPPAPPTLRSPNESVQLVREVSRKAAAATAALKSGSQMKVGEVDGPNRRRTMKRIDLQKISSPHLVSSSTSVDAIPLTPQSTFQRASSPAAESRSALKLTQRFKKLRGTLRKPPTPTGGEVTPFVLTPTSSTQAPLSVTSHERHIPSPTGPTQTVPYVPDPIPVGAISATVPGTFKVPVPSPPASAGPGLKSFFMARFRKPRKENTSNSDDRSRHHSSTSTSPVSPSQERDLSYSHNGASISPPGTARPHRSLERERTSHNRARSPSPDPATVNQLFNAASELGLDQGALNELLKRSTSTSSRTTTWTQASTSAFVSARSGSIAGRAAPTSRLPRAREGRSFDRPRTPEQQSYKPTPRPNAVANRHPEGEIVRRTIIYANDNPSVAELEALIQKNSTSHRPQRSASGTSIHSTGSATHEPPVPRLPSSLTTAQAVNTGESNGAYNVYSQEPSLSAAQNGAAEGPPSENVPSSTPPGEHGQGPALEVLQLSDGRVVWSVLDSLRAEEEDDSESLFRRSMASSRGNDVDDLEVRFKEHRRLSSKGSNYSQASQASRRRQAPVASGPRPETKLFKTNSSTIGRLIEDLSKNMDSGSFNFMRPSTAATPSASTSFHSDATGSTHQVERDLEALLNVINPPR